MKVNHIYVIEVMYANGFTEVFDDIESYETICDGLIFRLNHANSDVRTMIPVAQVIRIGKVKSTGKDTSI